MIINIWNDRKRRPTFRKSCSVLPLSSEENSGMRTIAFASSIRHFRCRGRLGQAAVVTAVAACAFSAITALAAPPWSPPVNAQSPSVAINESRSMVAAWARREGFVYTVQASINANGTWSRPVDLSPPGQIGVEPGVAIDNNGTATVVWSLDYVIQTSTCPAGGNWSAPMALSDVTTSAIYPQVVVDAAGNARAMWVRYDASGTPGIETADRPAGGIWSAPFLLAPDALTEFKLVVPLAERVEQYGTSSTGVALRWTAFEPPGGGRHPAVIVLHPGGFKTGEAGPTGVAQDLAAAGFLALATEYRLAPPHTPMNTPQHPRPSQNTVFPIDDGHYPEQTTDVQMAIRAARQDPRCNGLVYCVGGSAGASHSVYMAATGTPGDDMPDLIVCLSGPYDFADLNHLLTPCVPGETCFWESVINYVGVPDFINHRPELAEAAPITYVTGNFPPAFILVSSNDASQLGIHDFTQLLAKFNSVGITESTASFPKAGHYKQWVVPVGGIKTHAFEYWPQARSSVIAWLQAGFPRHSLAPTPSP